MAIRRYSKKQECKYFLFKTTKWNKLATHSSVWQYFRIAYLLWIWQSLFKSIIQRKWASFIGNWNQFIFQNFEVFRLPLFFHFFAGFPVDGYFFLWKRLWWWTFIYLKMAGCGQPWKNEYKINPCLWKYFARK